jgi:hypothetical protein
MKSVQAVRRRGTPLAILAILVGGWVFLRIATWEVPIGYPAMANSPASISDYAGGADRYVPTQKPQAGPGPHSVAYPHLSGYAQLPPAYGYMPYAYQVAQPHAGYLPQVVYLTPAGHVLPAPGYMGPAGGYGPYAGEAALYPGPNAGGVRRSPYPLAPHLVGGPRGSTGQVYGTDWRLHPGRGESPMSRKRDGKRYPVSQDGQPPFAAPPNPSQQAAPDRWLLDAYGFYRQGSNALSVTQGRQPIYGASQVAANLQWRARPSSSLDPRIYARAYQALVTGGETELAAGVSARPLGKFPVRLYGELRGVRNPQITDDGVSDKIDLRPAAYAVTEFLPQKLPLGFSLEAYGAAGYVGGDASTYFLDGQAAVTRPLVSIGKPGGGSTEVSVGAGVWGGAQEGVSRVDVGPTLRFDVDIGKIPARVSVDYREQVAGDAEPDSGVAATVSTRF